MILTAPKLSSSSPRKVPFEPFSVLKIISMNAENNAVSNYLSFLKFFLHFWLYPQITFFVHPKNSRFQCEASRWTEKTVREHPKIKEKLKKTQVVAHCIVFLLHRNNFEEGKWLEWNFSGWTWAQLRCSQYHFLNERKLTYTRKW